jgi:lysine-N-methylase
MESSKEQAIGLCPQYMIDFQCIGGACEANCCNSDWKIYLDRKCYHQLKEALDHSREDRELAKNAFKRNRAADKTEANYALIVPKNGACVFQETDGLCAIHRRFGEQYLGRVCRTYPRMIRVVGKRLELTGTFSCPEVVRRCLFEEQAMDILSFDPRPYFSSHRFACKKENLDSADPYITQEDTIRDIAVAILGDQRLPIQKRLFSLLYFAHRVKDFLYPQSPVFNEAQLAGEVDKLTDGVYAELWEQNFASQEPPLHLPMTILQSLLIGCYKKAAPEFGMLINTVWQSYARIDPSARSLRMPIHLQVEGDQISMQCRSLLSKYQERSRLFDEIYQPRLDSALSRYLQNLVIKESYTGYPDLFSWAFDLALRTALLRFLVVSHPGFTPFLTAEGPGEVDQNAAGGSRELFADTIVDVFFRFSRGLEHNKKFLPNLKQSLKEQKMADLAHAVLLIKI